MFETVRARIFEANFDGKSTIGECTTSGAMADSALVSGLSNPTGIWVVSVSVGDGETSTGALLPFGLTITFSLKLVVREPARPWVPLPFSASAEIAPSKIGKLKGILSYLSIIKRSVKSRACNDIRDHNHPIR
jgi:hypothetical protein